MLKQKLLHPELLRILGRLGHGSKILIADGNYPFATTLGPNSELVSLNLSPGCVNCSQVLDAIGSAVPIESVAMMGQPSSLDLNSKSEQTKKLLEDHGEDSICDPPIASNYREILSSNDYAGEITLLPRFSFYDESRDTNVGLTIATGETEIYANILLTIGVVR